MRHQLWAGGVGRFSGEPLSTLAPKVRNNTPASQRSRARHQAQVEGLGGALWSAVTEPQGDRGRGAGRGPGLRPGASQAASASGHTLPRPESPSPTTARRPRPRRRADSSRTRRRRRHASEAGRPSAIGSAPPSSVDRATTRPPRLSATSSTSGPRGGVRADGPGRGRSATRRPNRSRTGRAGAACPTTPCLATLDVLLSPKLTGPQVSGCGPPAPSTLLLTRGGRLRSETFVLGDPTPCSRIEWTVLPQGPETLDPTELVAQFQLVPPSTPWVLPEPSGRSSPEKRTDPITKGIIRVQVP